ncbi:MAG: polysaccharide deacetylase family protein [Ignavibacteria bacterium]|jgi:peptidoglycan/xylan/chitin deacetylase (PgdA/CDA1 family)
MKTHRNKALILWYHGICDEDFNLLKDYDERHIPKSLFRKQLEYLKNHGFSFITMTEMVNALNNKKLGKSVVLTFDDGFKNVVDNAYPIMKEFGAKGCFYLVSDLMGTDNLLWTDYIETLIRNHGEFKFLFQGKVIDYKLVSKKSYEYAMKDVKLKLFTLPEKQRLEYLKQLSIRTLNNIPQEFKIATWEQINSLDPNIMEIGSHTRRHPNCNNLFTEDELNDEIYNSKINIENNIKRKVDHFCFPAGSYNGRVISAVQKCGYLSSVTIENGFVQENSDVFKLKRIEATGQFLHFKANISGSVDFLRKIKRVYMRSLCKIRSLFRVKIRRNVRVILHASYPG